MIRKTPFHPRTSALNETGLWSHWSGFLSAEKYQMSEKFEYFAIRNSVGLVDTSPLYKYRITGKEAESYLTGVLARDIRKCQVGQAHYTLWCDDPGWVLEDGVIFRHSANEYMLTTARPNLAYFQGLVSGLSVEIEDVSDAYGALAVQGPHARTVVSKLAPEAEAIGYFRLTPAKIGDVPVTISRTGYTGDLGYEIWVARDDAVAVWDRVFDVASHYGGVPSGQIALLIARIEAGLVLIDVDYQSTRFAWNDDQRTTPIELGMGWMLRGLEQDDRPFVGRRAIEREISDGTSRWKTVGVIVDWRSWAEVHNSRGLIPPKSHTPDEDGRMLYDGNRERIGYASSFVYSPVLQRHIGIARVTPEHGEIGTGVGLEVTIDHRHEVVEAQVTGLPFFNPRRKTARHDG